MARGEARLNQLTQAGVVRRVDGKQVAPQRQELRVGFHRSLEFRSLFRGHALQPVHRKAIVKEGFRSLIVVSDQVGL